MCLWFTLGLFQNENFVLSSSGSNQWAKEHTKCRNCEWKKQLQERMVEGVMKEVCEHGSPHFGIRHVSGKIEIQILM